MKKSLQSLDPSAIRRGMELTPFKGEKKTENRRRKRKLSVLEKEVKKSLKVRGLSKGELAEEVGVTQSYLSGLLTGTRKLNYQLACKMQPFVDIDLYRFSESKRFCFDAAEVNPKSAKFKILARMSALWKEPDNKVCFKRALKELEQ